MYQSIKIKYLIIIMIVLSAVHLKAQFSSSYPNWIENSVFYQIYPQSFKDSNNDGVGDINGIIQKLNYVKSLGVTAIWLNPLFESPFLDAGYDITNYYKVAPRYGDNADLIRLVSKAHSKGLKVVLDLVTGHTSIYYSMR